MAHNLPAKRKKSGSENRKAKISKEKENKQLSSFMLNYLKTKDSNERTTPCSNKTEESNSQLLPDILPEILVNADCFEERNESEVPVFDLSRASRASRAENDGSSPHYRHAENQKN